MKFLEMLDAIFWVLCILIVALLWACIVKDWCMYGIGNFNWGIFKEPYTGAWMICLASRCLSISMP
jgi:hypothetical protein